jgi:diaminohydroxyphosphoribosylaminopyrimidine deaminase/5-amino-6-(5-phosphoribosylamino)uracil reductase
MTKLEGRSLILTVSTDEQKHQALKSVGFEVYNLPAKNTNLNLHAVMEFLHQQQINEVLVEAGSVLNGALLMEDLVDEWLIYMAPCVLGDQARGLFSLPGLKVMKDKKDLTLRDVRQFGPDLKLTLS